MILRLSVLDTADSSRQDVEIIAEPGSSVASLLSALPFKVGNRACSVDGAALLPGDTIGESPVVTGATVTIGSPPSARQGSWRQAGGSRPVGTFRCVSGPDAGLSADLGPGEHLIGRDPGASIRLFDSEISRRHAKLIVLADGRAAISDLGSSNGTAINGTRLAADRPAPLTMDTDVLELAGGQFEWLPNVSARPMFTRSRDGRLDFDRAFAPAPTISPTTVKTANCPTCTRTGCSCPSPRKTYAAKTCRRASAKPCHPSCPAGPSTPPPDCTLTFATPAAPNPCTFQQSTRARCRKSSAPCRYASPSTNWPRREPGSPSVSAARTWSPSGSTYSNLGRISC